MMASMGRSSCWDDAWGRERQRREAQQQVGKQPNDGSFDGAFGSRDFPGVRAGTPIMACPIDVSVWLGNR